jgi:hypothetical protein
MKCYAALLFFLVLLPSCQSLESFPRDDHKTSDRWLEVGYGTFSETSRTVVTDKDLVRESYKRADTGRQRGRHLLKQQTKLQLSSENVRRFWQYVDRAKVLDWTDADMPAETHQPSLTYRQGSKHVELPVAEGCCTVHVSGFRKLTDQIYELEQRAKAEVIALGERVER